jgi:MSHA biogenesis protein MshL
VHAAALAAALAVTGCAQQAARFMETRDEINAQLASAARDRVPPKAPPAPDAVKEALIPPLVVELPRQAVRQIEPRFDLAVNNAPAAQVFLAIASGTRYSMVVHPDIRETITVNLRDVTVFEALDTLREIHGYDYTVQGNRIIVRPIAMQTRMYQINYLMSARQGRSDVRVTSGSIATPMPGVAGVPGMPGVPGAMPGMPGMPGAMPGMPAPGMVARPIEASRVITTADNDFWADLEKAVRALIGTEQGRNVVVNPQSGLIVVRAMPNELRQVEQFLRRKQAIVERQVMLEARIIEVTLRDTMQTGINWAAFRAGDNSRFGAGVLAPGALLRTDGSMTVPTARGPDGSILGASIFGANPARSRPLLPDPLDTLAGVAGSGTGVLRAATTVPGTAFGLAFQTSNFATLLSFLETQGTVDVLSSPRIATMSNQKAILKVGTDEFFVTHVTTAMMAVGGVAQMSPSITVQPFFSGISLGVTPQIDDDDNITLHIHPSVSSVVDRPRDIDLGTLGQFRLPLASSTVNEIDSIVRVTDGNIVAIGGLMQNRAQSERSQVPGLGDLPVLGNLFRNIARSQQKSEIVILLRPTVIRSDANWQQDILDTQNRIGNMRRPPSADGPLR